MAEPMEWIEPGPNEPTEEIHRIYRRKRQLPKLSRKILPTKICSGHDLITFYSPANSLVQYTYAVYTRVCRIEKRSLYLKKKNPIVPRRV